MTRYTPFHARVDALSKGKRWEEWAGYLSATMYELDHIHEYNAVRLGCGLFDVSPLYKYFVRGRDAMALLNRMVTRDVSKCRVGQVIYTAWCDDAGKIMMQRLLDAAERDVRVRVLIDDSMTESDPEYLALLGAHQNVEVRLYKPFGPKHKSLVLRWIDYVADLRVLNRRMHNKLFVVDGSVAIVGGRNIGNEYFEYPGPFVFRSRDLLALGPVVDSAAGAFDRYWNSDWTVPIENLTRDGVDGAVVYVQDGSREKPGPMLGAAYTSLH